MAGEYILGQNNNNNDDNNPIVRQINDIGIDINQEETPNGALDIPEVTAEDVINIMKHKALAFDMLFYITCVNHKTGKIDPPKNKTDIAQDDYVKIFNVCKALLELGDLKTKDIYLKNMKKYLEGLVKRL